MGIEMLAGVAEAGPDIGGQLMSAADAKVAFDGFIKEFKAKAAAATPQERANCE